MRGCVRPHPPPARHIPSYPARLSGKKPRVTSSSVKNAKRRFLCTTCSTRTCVKRTSSAMCIAVKEAAAARPGDHVLAIEIGKGEPRHIEQIARPRASRRRSADRRAPHRCSPTIRSECGSTSNAGIGIRSIRVAHSSWACSLSERASTLLASNRSNIVPTYSAATAQANKTTLKTSSKHHEIACRGIESRKRGLRFGALRAEQLDEPGIAAEQRAHDTSAAPATGSEPRRRRPGCSRQRSGTDASARKKSSREPAARRRSRTLDSAAPPTCAQMTPISTTPIASSSVKRPPRHRPAECAPATRAG